MTMTLFIDANVFLYALGSSHPYKLPCESFLLQVGLRRFQAVTSIEVFQEVLHRCDLKGRRTMGLEAVRRYRVVMEEVWPVTDHDLSVAETVWFDYPDIRIRDAIHAAVMLNHGLRDIVSYDRHFDRVRGIHRMEPSDVSDQFWVQEATPRQDGGRVRGVRRW